MYISTRSQDHKIPVPNTPGIPHYNQINQISHLLADYLVKYCWAIRVRKSGICLSGIRFRCHDGPEPSLLLAALVRIECESLQIRTCRQVQARDHEFLELFKIDSD